MAVPDAPDATRPEAPRGVTNGRRGSARGVSAGVGGGGRSVGLGVFDGNKLIFRWQ